MESGLEACLGMSRKWDAREAGREVAKSSILNLNEPPKFFLLFSTIHYEADGGFQELLKGVWDVLPKGTPLIGGTVAGFLNNYGCYTRGVTALAVSCPGMDVAIGFGNNTKRNPKKAVKKSVSMIKNGLSNSRYKNKFLLNFVSGASVMKIPGQGYTRVVDSGFMSKFIMQAFGISQYLLQKGVGREDEIFEETANKLPDYHMILGTSIDDHKGINNYQFYNDHVLTNAVVNLGIATDMDLDVCTTHGMKQSDVHFKITKLSRNKHIIKEINHKPARQELSDILDWPKDFLNDKTMTHTIIYYPISLKRHGREVPVVMPFILKDSIMTPCVIDDGEVSILTVSGDKIIEALDKNLQSFQNFTPAFGLCSTCMTILDTLGNQINIVRDKTSSFFKDTPFLMIFCAGEGTYSPRKEITYANMSFNISAFGKQRQLF